jgi:hypothetical protein
MPWGSSLTRLRSVPPGRNRGTHGRHDTLPTTRPV